MTDLVLENGPDEDDGGEIISDENFERVLQGLREGLAIRRGELPREAYRLHTPTTLQLRWTREALGMERPEFASVFGFELADVEAWEDGRSEPGGAQASLAKLIVADADFVRRTLSPVPIAAE